MAGAGPFRVRSTDRRRRSTTALYAGARHLGTDIQRAGGRRRTGCSSLHQGSSLRRRRKRGALAHGIATPSSTLSAMRKEAPRPAPDTRKRMIARSPSAVSKPCRPPPNSATRGAKPCATGWQNAEPSSHRARTARQDRRNIIVLPPQGLAPYSHPLRPQKLRRRNRPCRRRHLVAVMSLDPSSAGRVSSSRARPFLAKPTPGLLGLDIGRSTGVGTEMSGIIESVEDNSRSGRNQGTSKNPFRLL